ncbi:hypothetical protein HMPREF3156_00224 [Neisseria sp. HMSC06F02]|nr:hypothetical protein HMPREF3156_00224 [Neisseria sp. HMSC06F02]
MPAFSIYSQRSQLILLQRSPHIKRSSEHMFQTTFLTLAAYLLC